MASGPGDRGDGWVPAKCGLPPVSLLAAGLGLSAACSVWGPTSANDLAAAALDDEAPPSGWRRPPDSIPEIIDELSHTGSWS